MPRSRRQLRVRNPDVFLLLPLLARSHCHAHILQTKPVDDSFILGRHPEFHHRLLGTILTDGRLLLMSSPPISRANSPEPGVLVRISKFRLPPLAAAEK